MNPHKGVVSALCGVLLLCSVRAEAQTTPATEVSVGYAYLYDLEDELSFPVGWYGDVDVNLNNWIGIMGEAGGSYKSQDVFGTSVDLNVHTFLGGVRFTSRHNVASPFVQYLMGIGHVGAGVPGSGVGASASNLAVQVGGGVAIRMSDRMGVRVGGDIRRIFSDTFNDARQIRVTGGVVLTFGER